MHRILLVLTTSTSLFAWGQESFNDNGKFGFKSNGEVVIAPQYEYASDFSGGLACVKKDGKWGYINPSNEWVSKEYEKVQPLNFGLAKVYTNELFGLIDSTGKEIIAPGFASLTIDDDGYYILEQEGKKGLRSSNIEIPCKYESVGQYHPNYAWGENEDDSYDIYDENGLILENQETYISNWRIEEGYFIARENGKYGLFNVDSKSWSVEPEYEYIVPIYCDVYAKGGAQSYLVYAFFLELNEAKDNYSLEYETTEKNNIVIRSLEHKKLKLKGVTGYRQTGWDYEYTLYLKKDKEIQLSELIIDKLKLETNTSENENNYEDDEYYYED